LKRIDLHTHSRFSDGTSPPRELVARAAAAGVEVLFLTDHDSVSGYPEAQAAARGLAVKAYCGVEINTSQSDRVHILGYGLRWKDPAFAARLSELRARRLLRVQRIVENLRREGLDISFEEVRGASRETLGRPHVADALRSKGIVASRQEAFQRFLAQGRPGFVGSLGPSPQEAIALIREAGGVACLAHPETVQDFSELEAWVAKGLEALEVYYGAHSPAQVRRFAEMAARYRLLATGGTDYHGPGSGREQPLGVEVPEEVYSCLMERLSSCA